MPKSNVMNDISSPTFLTPTTLRNITQIFESEECLKGIQTFEETGDAVKAVAATEFEKQSATTKLSNSTKRSGNTYFNLDSKSWQGGTTTVLTPTKLIASIAEKFESEDSNDEEQKDQSSDEEENSSKILNGNCLPEPIVQTNRQQQKKQQNFPRRTMITRSLSNMSNSDGNIARNTYSNVENKKIVVARKTSTRGRKRQNYEPEDDLTPEERERLHIRRIRNKEAAARCRKRRVDQTTGLQVEVDNWNAKKRALEAEIGALRREKEELEFVLGQHCQGAVSGLCALGGARRRMVAPAHIVVRRPSSATIPNQLIRQQQINGFQQTHQVVVRSQNPIVAIKSEPTVIVEPVNQPYLLPEQVHVPQVKVEQTYEANITKNAPNNNMEKPLRRPAFLGLAKITMVQQQQTKLSEHGIPIETPTSNIPSLSFETFTSTGLTPTATPVSGFSFPVTSTSTPGCLNTPMTNNATIGNSCSTQQRSSEVATGSASDLNSPEGVSLVSL
jgi:hypothetical protein